MVMGVEMVVNGMRRWEEERDGDPISGAIVGAGAGIGVGVLAVEAAVALACSAFEGVAAAGHELAAAVQNMTSIACCVVSQTLLVPHIRRRTGRRWGRRSAAQMQIVVVPEVGSGSGEGRNPNRVLRVLRVEVR